MRLGPGHFFRGLDFPVRERWIVVQLMGSGSIEEAISTLIAIAKKRKITAVTTFNEYVVWADENSDPAQIWRDWERVVLRGQKLRKNNPHVFYKGAVAIKFSKYDGLYLTPSRI